MVVSSGHAFARHAPGAADGTDGVARFAAVTHPALEIARVRTQGHVAARSAAQQSGPSVHSRDIAASTASTHVVVSASPGGAIPFGDLTVPARLRQTIGRAQAKL